MKHKIRCNNCNKINNLNFNPVERKTIKIGKAFRTIEVGYSKLLAEVCEFCKEPLAYRNTHAEGETVNKAYAKLVEAIIYSAMQPVGFQARTIGFPPKANRAYQRELQESAKRNLRFAWRSPLLDMYAESFGVDKSYVVEKIIKNNKPYLLGSV